MVDNIQEIEIHAKRRNATVQPVFGQAAYPAAGAVLKNNLDSIERMSLYFLYLLFVSQWNPIHLSKSG